MYFHFVEKIVQCQNFGQSVFFEVTGCVSPVGSVYVLSTNGPEIDPCVWQIPSWKRFARQSKLSVTDERMCTKYL